MAPPLCFTKKHAKTSASRWSICWAVGLSSLTLAIVWKIIDNHVIQGMPMTIWQILAMIAPMAFLALSVLFWWGYFHRDRAFEVMLTDKYGAELLQAGSKQLDIYTMIRMDYRDRPSEELAKDCQRIAIGLAALKQNQIAFLEHVRTKNGWPPVDYCNMQFLPDYPNQYDVATAI